MKYWTRLTSGMIAWSKDLQLLLVSKWKHESWLEELWSPKICSCRQFESAKVWKWNWKCESWLGEWWRGPKIGSCLPLRTTPRQDQSRFRSNQSQSKIPANFNLTESVQDTTQPMCIGIFKRENSILIRIVTNLGVADGAVASLSSYAGSVILVREVESARVVVRLDESCRPWDFFVFTSVLCNWSN